MKTIFPAFEPNLLIPGKKPVGPVRLSSKYSGSILKASLMRPRGYGLVEDRDGVFYPCESGDSFDITPEGVAFNAVNHKAVLGTGALPDEFTAVFSYKYDAISASDTNYIFHKGAYNECALFGRQDLNRLYMQFGQGSTYITSTGIFDGDWHHCAVTVKRNTTNGVQFFNDGAYVDQEDTGNTWPVSTDVLEIGNRTTAPANDVAQGTIGYFALFNRRLTSGEIAAIADDPYNEIWETAYPPLIFKTTGVAGVTLTIQSSLHTHTADNVALTQAHNLTVSDSSQTQSVDNIDLSSAVVLVVGSANHAQTVDGLTLVQASILSVGDALHDHSADNLGLVQANSLAVEDALHDHAADNITLSSAGSLAVDDASHEQTSDNVALTQANSLSTDDAQHDHTADGVTLTQAHNLGVDDATHNHEADNITLSTEGVLSVGSAEHSHTADGVELTQAHTIDVADALHDHTADAVELSEGVVLVVASSEHLQSADNVTLTQAQLLAVADALHTQTADTIDLTVTHAVLVVDDAMHDQLADNINLAIPGLDVETPIGRVYLVRPENRVLVITTKQRLN